MNAPCDDNTHHNNQEMCKEASQLECCLYVSQCHHQHSQSFSSSLGPKKLSAAKEALGQAERALEASRKF